MEITCPGTYTGRDGRSGQKTAQLETIITEMLNPASGGVVFTTIQKFQPDDDGNVYEELSPRENIIIIVDEAHRSQYGFKARTIDERDAAGNLNGKKTYGFAKYLRDALPHRRCPLPGNYHPQARLAQR